MFEILWTLMVAVAAFRVRRHVPFFAVTVTMALVAPLPGPPPRLTGDRWNLATATVVAVSFLLAVSAALLLAGPAATCMPATAERSARPEASAVEFIRSAGLRGRVVMWFDWGLYAIWHVGDRVQPSIDNRRETVYSAQVVSEHLRFYRGDDPDYPNRLGADYVWIPSGLPAVNQLSLRGWVAIYRGPRSVVLSRTAAPLVAGEESASLACFPAP